MIKVGLTGGIGSGKTIVAQIFSTLGISVYNADRSSKQLMNENIELKKQLISEFGKEIYLGQNLNKKLLAQIIFSDAKALQKINSIVHPLVRNDFMKWLDNKKHHKYVIEEAAILFETGLYKEFDKIITVVSPMPLKIKRIIKRDKTSKKEIIKRMKNQWTDEQKIKLSDYIIKNDERQLVIPQVLKINDMLHKY